MCFSVIVLDCFGVCVWLGDLYVTVFKYGIRWCWTMFLSQKDGEYDEIGVDRK